jgi:hypothetical protein
MKKNNKYKYREKAAPKPFEAEAHQNYIQTFSPT